MSERGSSLVEVLVALMVLTVALGSLSNLTRASVRALTTAQALDESHAWLRGLADSVTAFGMHGTGNRTVASGSLSWYVPSAPAEPAWARFTHKALDRPVELYFMTRSEW